MALCRSTGGLPSCRSSSVQILEVAVLLVSSGMGLAFDPPQSAPSFLQGLLPPLGWLHAEKPQALQQVPMQVPSQGMLDQQVPSQGMLNQQVPMLNQQVPSQQLVKPLTFLGAYQQPLGTQNLLQQLGSLQAPYVNAAPLLPENNQLQLPESSQLQLPGTQQNAYTADALGLSVQPANAQVPYAQSMLESPRQFAALQNTYGLSSLQSTVVTLQAQLATERKNELLLASMATKKEEALMQMNQSFARASSLAEAGVEHERHLQEQLRNATEVNKALRAELAEIQDQDSHIATQLFDEQSQVSLLQDKLREAESVKGHALKVMKDVRVAQDKVRHTEDLLRNLIPELTPERPAMQTVMEPAQLSQESPVMQPSKLSENDIIKLLAGAAK